MDSIVTAFEEAIQAKDAEKGSESLTEAERVVLAVEVLEREVNNGGYDQYFVNTPGEDVEIVLESLSKIACPVTAALTKRAIEALGPLPVINSDTLDEAMSKEDEDRDEKLAEIDTEFLGTGERIDLKLFDYIKKNKASILA